MVESKQTNIVKPILLILFIFFSLVSCSPDGGPGTVQTPGGGETPGSNSTVCPPGSVCPTVPADSTSSPLTNTMAFSEEFDGDSLPSLFWPLPIWFDHPGVTDENAEAQAIWTADSVSVSGGYLHLQATRLDAPEQGRQYASGYAQTGGYLYDPSVPSRWFKYGYFEALIYLPDVAGAWAAFWLWSDPQSPQEIDIVEILMRQSDVTYHTLHYDGEIFQVSKKFTSPLTGWHTFAVDWQPGLIVWYVDGLESGRYEDDKNRFTNEMYIVLSLQMGGTWAGVVDDDQLPTEMLVDYVRVWAQKHRSACIQNETNHPLL